MVDVGHQKVIWKCFSCRPTSWLAEPVAPTRIAPTTARFGSVMVAPFTVVPDTLAAISAPSAAAI